MAASPAPVLTIKGIAREVQRFEQTNTETGESRQAARVQVLTDLGGFAEVYVGTDHLDVLPAETEDLRSNPRSIEWSVEAAAWNRAAFGQENIPPAERRRYAVLSLKFISDVAAVRGSRALASVAV